MSAREVSWPPCSLIMKKLKVLKSINEHPLDNPKNWCKPGVHVAPYFDVAGYQQKINKIVGISVDGYPIVRLSWAWDCRKWENTDWDEFGNATKGEWRQKYKALTVEIGNDEYVDIAPPRFVLEDRFEPGQYAQSWELTRYHHDPETCKRCANRAAMCNQIAMFCVHRNHPAHDPTRCRSCVEAFNGIESSTSCDRRDKWGPAPREGWYNLLSSPSMSSPFGVIADHDGEGKCCKKLWAASREICYGRFRFPDGRELRILERAVALRARDAEVDPHSKELSPMALEQARVIGLQSAEDAQVAKRTELKEMYADEVLVHGASVIPPQALIGLHETGRRTPVNKLRFT